MASDQRQDRIAAVVVTYNRKALLMECLESLLSQEHPLDAVYVVDNHSSDGTYEFLRDGGLAGRMDDQGGGPWEIVRSVPLPNAPGRQTEIHFVRMPENTGGAGGFHEGMKRASQAGFDWLWLMDDDLLTASDALKWLVRKKDALASTHGSWLLLNSVVLSRNAMDGDRLAFPLQELSKSGYPRLKVYHWRLSEVQTMVQDGLYRWACPFNGTFVSSLSLAQIGLPNKDFYIKGDEKDFLWRAARRVALYTVVDSRVFHPEPQPGIFDWKQYYGIRNMFVINKYFNYTMLRNVRWVVVSFLRGLCHGRKGLLLVLRAIRDGLTGRLGKRDDVRTWLNGL